MKIGHTIKRARKAINYTQEDLAFHAGMFQSRICDIENGTHSPTVKTLEFIAAAMGCELEINFVPTVASAIRALPKTVGEG